MRTRLALIGCGAVGSIHAANLTRERDVELKSVYSPDAQMASSFASRYCIGKVSGTLDDAITVADAAIVCSPSAVHFEQAWKSLDGGLHTLVEFPPCGEVREAEELAARAEKQGVLLGCAHTARYLLPYTRIRAALEAGSIGEIREISYVRCPQLKTRDWTDNALFHHAAHVIDLVLVWCGGLEPLACTAFPDASAARSVSLLAKLPGGGSLTLSVSYGAKFPLSRMVVVGTKHTIETDGFSYLRSDLEDLQFTGNEADVYEQAICDQDVEFIGACRGMNGFVPWSETVNLIRIVKEFQVLIGS